MRSFLVLCFLGTLLLALALAVRSGRFARENPGAPLTAGMRAAQTQSLSEHDERLVAERFQNLIQEPSGLRWIRQQAGNGTTPGSMAKVRVHYDGHLLTGGKFDSSRDRGSPQVFELGRGSIIDGMEEALKMMQAGERRTLVVPWWLGYGKRGRTPYIPAYATLVFDVELIEFSQ